jgi:tRNA(Arg) A34 adenosine deaminase TadA
VVYAAKDPVAGAMGSVLNLPRFPLGSRPQVEGGLLLEEARDMLQEFFKSKR